MNKANLSAQRIMMFMLMGIMLISIVSAMEWDNVKNYDAETKEVTITNALGLGGEIAKIQLNTPLNNKVGVGYIKVAEFTITQSYDGTYEDALKLIDFYDIKKNMQEKEIQFDYKYKEVTQKSRQDCSIDNKTMKETCETIYYNDTQWKDYNGKDILKGEVTIGIFTNTKEGDYVEWIPTYYGVEIDEWASWDAGLNTNLISYYALEEDAANTDVTDAHGSNDGTASANTNGLSATGKVGDGFDFESGSSHWVNCGSDSSLNLREELSISAWVKRESTGSYQVIAAKWNANGGSPRPWILLFLDSDKIRFSLNDNGQYIDTTDTFTSTEDWYHVVAVYSKSGNSMKIYVNNVEKASDNYNTDLEDGSSEPNTIGCERAGSPATFFDGLIDEVGIWNRVLTTDEITQLYNGGDGITYNQNDPPNVTLNSPANDTEQISSTITFNYSCADDLNITNVTLNINGTVNTTTTWGYNASTGDLITSLDFAKGDWNWSVTCVDNSSQSNTSEVRTFSIKKILENSISYTSTIPEGLSDTFTINISSDGTQTMLANFTYGDTTYTTSKAGNDTEMIFSRTLTPTVTGNNTFYWTIFYGSEGINSTFNNQTVEALNLTNCDLGGTTILNFSIKDEETKTLLTSANANTTIEVDVSVSLTNGTEINSTYFNVSNSASGYVGVCTGATLTSSPLLLDATIRYDEDSRASEFYIIKDFSLTNTSIPENIDLYDLLDADAQEFKITYKDNNFVRVEDALIKVQRYYIQDGVFRTVEQPITDKDGSTLASLVLGDVIYTFIVQKDGVVLATFDNVLAVCENAATGDCKINLNAPTSAMTIDDWDTIEGVSYTLDYNKSTRTVTSIFTTSSGETAAMVLNVTVDGSEACSNSLTSSSGTLSCIIPNSFQNVTARGLVTADGNDVSAIFIPLYSEPADIYGSSFVTLGILSFLTIVGIGLSGNGMIMGIFILLGVLINGLMLFTQTGGFVGATSTFLWLVVAIVIVLFKANRRSP